MMELFAEILNSIENQDLAVLARSLVDTIPDYFWHVPASSTGKYHPDYALGEGGLVRHTVAVVRFLNHIFNINCYGSVVDSRTRDLLRIAAMMHDSRKSGSQEDYEKEPHTKFEHPLLAAEVVRKFKGECNPKELEVIASCIETHMGHFNTSKYSNITLPTPQNGLQKLLHLADYLASRKDIEVKI